MSQKKGIIALMGSGELTATMVEVHKELLSGLPDPPEAVFLNTPAGFELNADQISHSKPSVGKRDTVEMLMIGKLGIIEVKALKRVLQPGKLV